LEIIIDLPIGFAINNIISLEADRVIGGIGSTAAVTMLRDALLSTAL